jgi:hypothetical protein
MTSSSFLTVSMALFLFACIDEDAAPPDPAEDFDSTGDVEMRADPMPINIASYSGAKCNDGSVPIVKVQLDDDGGRNWLVYLEGGGKCGSIEDCETRWRDCDPSPRHSETGLGGAVGGKDKMQASPGGMNFNGNGILDFNGHGDEVSPFEGKGFNRIFIPYCSSDTWRGLGHSHQVDYEPTCGSLKQLQTLHFGGALIVEAVIDQIMADDQAPQAGNVIVLAGGSAGGAGVLHNLDRVTEQVRATEPNIMVVGIADSANGVGLDQHDGPTVQNLDEELFWAGLDPETVDREPGDPIHVRIDETCFNAESGGDKDWCHHVPYTVVNHIDSPLLMTSNTYDHVVDASIMAAFEHLECGTTVIDTGGVDPDLDALYFAYCDPATNPLPDVEAWIRYQMGVEGPAMLDGTDNVAYFIVHSPDELHDQLLKHSDTFYMRAETMVTGHGHGDHVFSALGSWSSPSGYNDNPSVASTVACALEWFEDPSSPNCRPGDVRVTSDLPTQVDVIENYLN